MAKPEMSINPKCWEILKKISQHKFAGPFLEPVDAEALGIPDYYQVIKHPMDLGTIEVRARPRPALLKKKKILLRALCLLFVPPRPSPWAG